jgi:hypothetical protein
MNACNHSHFVDPYTVVEEGHNFFETSEPWYAPLHFCALKAHKVSPRSFQCHHEVDLHKYAPLSEPYVLPNAPEPSGASEEWVSFPIAYETA